MNTWMKSLAGLAVVSLFTFAPRVQAAPDECAVVCTCNNSCATKCWDWTTNRVSTCGATDSACRDVCRTQPKVSMTPAREQQRSSEDAQVCGEQPRASDSSSAPAKS